MENREGVLDRNEDGRYVARLGDYNPMLTAGSVCEVSISGIWFKVRVEFNDAGYYMTTDDESFRPFLGMKVRI